MGEVVITVKNLSKIYKLYKSPQDRLKESLHPFRKKYHRNFFALNDVSFEIKKGEVVGIVGRNGAGKSTLLSIINSVLTPTSGNINIQGRVSAILELSSGFNPEFSGYDNIYFKCALMGYKKDYIDKIFEEIIDFAEIGDFIYQPVKIYSSGMLVRLAFAIVINVDPDILIIDEALAVGDILFQKKCINRIHKFRNDGKTILFVSHSPNSVNELCSRALLLDMGRLLLEGPSKLVTTQYQRLLFSNKEDYHKIKNEIIEINKDNELKEIAYKEISSNVNHSNESEKDIINFELEKKPKDIFTAKALFIPGMITSPQYIKNTDKIEITGIQIETLKGEVVNSLISGEKYIFTYKVKFFDNFENIGFHWVIKSKNEVKLSSCRYPKDFKTVINAKKGEIFKLNWTFDCNLLEKEYFVDITLPQYVDNERSFLFKIYDALIFSIQTNNSKYNKYNFLGYVNFNQTLEIKKDFF
jgi:lipopolysaccharide transport system ATP-binding protein